MLQNKITVMITVMMMVMMIMVTMIMIMMMVMIMINEIRHCQINCRQSSIIHI